MVVWKIVHGLTVSDSLVRRYDASERLRRCESLVCNVWSAGITHRAPVFQSRSDSLLSEGGIMINNVQIKILFFSNSET